MHWRSCNNCGMESEEQKKKLNDDLVVFMRKRSETDAPRYTARLKTYVDFKQKRRRAAAARRHTTYRHHNDSSTAKERSNAEQRDKSPDNLQHNAADDRVDRRRGGEKCAHKPRSPSRSRSAEPVDSCGRRRRKRRVRMCRRRSRRRRRRSCGRRRRRSRSRRRRRRSCRRRRRRRRRCR